jgi:hypothetical protein
MYIVSSLSFFVLFKAFEVKRKVVEKQEKAEKREREKKETVEPIRNLIFKMNVLSDAQTRADSADSSRAADPRVEALIQVKSNE